ncbi:MAG: O-antigen ligase family protein [Chloroflexi bacterium]|nr:O-antigen ligase family protein [Chloroflexota bacterium]
MRSVEWKIVAAGAVAVTFLGALTAVAPFNALILVALVVALPAAVWLLGNVSRALFLLLAVVALFPRFASPVSIGFKPTLLDFAVLGLIATQLRRNPAIPAIDGVVRVHAYVDAPVAALMLVAVASFIVGVPNGALTTLVLRRFGEMLMSLTLLLVLTRVLRGDVDMQTRFVQFTLLLGGFSALLGLVLYVMPDEVAVRVLSVLRIFDYPSGPEVLRFILDDPTLTQRATGLWIDPNAFGGYLLLATALCLPQLVIERPFVPRWLAVACLGVMGMALVATVSRGAMLGLLLAGGVIGVLRYRRLLGLGLLIVALVLVLPQTRELVSHFIAGFQGNDLSTQMRFGEYKDAFRLIERYPVLGVGFTGSPDVDLYVGVSSMYLLILQQMGVLGMAAFVAVIGALAAGAVRAWPYVREDAHAAAIFLGAHASVIGALFAGIFDHYFFNIDFHNSVTWMCAALALAAASQTFRATTRVRQLFIAKR